MKVLSLHSDGFRFIQELAEWWNEHPSALPLILTFFLELISTAGVGGKTALSLERRLAQPGCG